MVLAPCWERDALVNEKVGSLGANEVLWTPVDVFRTGQQGQIYWGGDRSQGAGGIVACSGLGKTAAKVKFTLSRNSFSVSAQLSL